LTDGMDQQACREGVMENISFDQLLEEYGREDVEGVADLITDSLLGLRNVPTSRWTKKKCHLTRR